MNKQLPIFIVLVTLMSCSQNYGRYQQKHDSTPVRLPTEAELIDPIPRVETPSRGGNKHYQVRGKHYQVLKSAENFQQSGTASWYGNKFHGHLTSNGEIYNMYSMSAAHKNLPLPTYVEVTNHANNKKVIVRVNDRGPFHQSRIIDLSYSAAYKLDMLKTGTAQVTIRSITQPIAEKDSPKISSKQKNTTQNAPLSGKYIQVFATRNSHLAKSTASALNALYQQQTIFPENNGVYKVQLGPFAEQIQLENTLKTLKTKGYPNAFKVIHGNESD